MKLNPIKFSPEYLTNKPNKAITLDNVKKAIETKDILEALVISCDDDLTLELNIGKGITGYVKFEDIESARNGNKPKPIAAMSKVGRHIKFVPISIDKEDENGVVVKCSRAAAQDLCYDNFISKLTPGDIIDARIVGIENYGVFCDIGCGIISLLPTNLISITHVTNPKELLSNISSLKVVIKSIQPNGKIQLSHRELLGTWKEEVSKLSVGKTVYGTVLGVESYGVFVRLSQNLSGLASPSERFDLQPGDTVVVHVNSITESKLKIKLSIINKIENCEESVKFNYYIDHGHIDKWVYADGKKVIQTDFTAL